MNRKKMPSSKFAHFENKIQFGLSALSMHVKIRRRSLIRELPKKLDL